MFRRQSLVKKVDGANPPCGDLQHHLEDWNDSCVQGTCAKLYFIVWPQLRSERSMHWFPSSAGGNQQSVPLQNTNTVGLQHIQQIPTEYMTGTSLSNFTDQWNMTERYSTTSQRTGNNAREQRFQRKKMLKDAKNRSETAIQNLKTRQNGVVLTSRGTHDFRECQTASIVPVWIDFFRSAHCAHQICDMNWNQPCEQAQGTLPYPPTTHHKNAQNIQLYIYIHIQYTSKHFLWMLDNTVISQLREGVMKKPQKLQCWCCQGVEAQNWGT